MPDITATREWVEREIADYDHLSKVCAAEWDRTDCARRAAILRWALDAEKAMREAMKRAGPASDDPSLTEIFTEDADRLRAALAACPIEEGA